MLPVTLLTDYRGAFYSSTTNAKTLCSMNVERLIERLAEQGMPAVTETYPSVRFDRDWTERIVLYQSAEDEDLHYKSYIEDVVLALTLAGARVVPQFKYLRAHHNKVFLEFLQEVSRLPETTTLSSQAFGTLEDFHTHPQQWPLVAKTSFGAGSRGVALLETQQQAMRVLPKMTQTFSLKSAIREWGKRLLRRGYVPYSLHRRKFVLQQFLPKLARDYKVLLYGTRAFVLTRQVRHNDFRASGSGLFEWPPEVPAGLLDFCWRIVEGFDVPHISLDIAESNGQYHVLEAQFVQFGPLTLERSMFHWQRSETGAWVRKDGAVELEEVFAAGIAYYLRRHAWLT